MPVIPALGRLRQENFKLMVSLDYIHSDTLSEKHKQNKK
jgi:hypothetical protein